MRYPGNSTNRPRHNHPRQRGVALILVLVTVAMATVLSMTFLSSQATTHGVSQNVQKLAQARSVAESALVVAINYVQTDTDFRTDKSHGQWVSGASFNGGTFDLFGYDGKDTDSDGIVDDTDSDLSDDTSDPVTLTVVGYYQGVSHTVHAVVTPGSGTSAGELLFVVVNESSLAAGDIKRKAFFESLGWTVTPIDDDSTQGEFDAALAVSNVVYISETVSSNDVSTAFTSASVGVVDEERLLHDELELASSGASTHTTQTIQITDNSHYITSPFSLGSLQTASTPFVHIRNNSTIGSGAQVLATNSSPTLFVFDVGATLQDGSMAAGRRVALFIGDTDMDFDDLTDDGKTIVERSLVWASKEVSLASPIARWALEETSGTTAADSMGLSDGTFRNNPTLGVTGANALATRFDGSNDHIEIPHNDAMLLDNGSISFWFNADNTSGHQAIFSKDSSDYDTGGHCHIYLDSSRLKVRFQSTGTSYTVQSSSGISSGVWHHVVFTFGSGGMALYLDGALVDTDSYTGGMGSTSGGIGNHEPIAIGGGTWNSGNLTISTTNYFYDGMIDDVRMYGSALSASQVIQVYSGSVAEETSEPQLIALYEFQEVVPVPPVKLAQWALDDTVSGGGVSFAVAVADQIIMYTNTKIDSFSSSAGAYGGANIGSDAYVSTNSTSSNRVQLYSSATIAGDFDVGPGGNPSSVILSYSSIGITGSTGSLSSTVSFPSLSAPSGMPSSLGNKTYNSGTILINSDTTYQSLTLNNGSTIRVSGDVRIQVKSNLTINTGQILLDPGASLELYVGGNVVLYNNSAINTDSTRTSDLTLYMYGPYKNMTMTSTAIVSGVVYVSRDLTMHGNATLYGAAIVKDDITMSTSAAIHIDTDITGASLIATDTIASNNGADNGGITPGVSGHGDGGTAFQFDGSDDYVEVAHSDDYLLDSGAVSFWFKPDDTSGHQAMISKDSTNYDTGGHLHIYLDGSTLKVRLQSTSGDNTVESSGISAGNWYHAVVSWGSGGLKVFVNGIERDTDSYTGGLGTTSGGIGNYEPIVIGAGTWTSGNLVATPITYPYHGSIDDVRVYDKGLDETQATALYNGNALDSGIATTVYDTSDYGTALNLNIEDTANVTWISGGGLTIDSATRISSAAAATKLHTALTATDELSIEVIYTPENVSQSGPARIVSYSGGSTTRNFTIGQDSDSYISRLRTSSTTSNGTPDIASAAVLAAGTEEHLIVSYDGENVTMYRNGASEVVTARTGTLSWDSSFRFMFADEINGGREWLGTLSRVAIYDRAFNANQANNVFAGGEPGDGTASEAVGIGGIDWIER